MSRYASRQLLSLARSSPLAISHAAQEPSFKPKDGFVPDAQTAVIIGEAVLMPIYGEKQIISERPFQATLKGDVWTVAGSLYCGGRPGALCAGGVAEVHLSKTSGEILYMMHGK